MLRILVVFSFMQSMTKRICSPFSFKSRDFTTSWGKSLPATRVYFRLADLSMKYHGPDLFEQKACRIFREPVQAYSTLVEGTYIRELWLLEDGTFAEVAVVRVDCRFTTESFYTVYRTVRHTMTKKDWPAYIPEVIADAFEDFCKYPFDGEKGAIYEV